ncbi:MAG: hypothetical protein HYR58_01475 [Acidobacteria bacterium]|nr:hypothetical protein [Acidobacteriota bacterium]
MRVIQTVQRPLILLATVVLAQVLLLAVQIKRGDVRLIRIVAVWAMTPLQSAGTSLIDSVGSTWNNYVSLRKTRQENEKLRKELADLKLRTAHLESRAAEASERRGADAGRAGDWLGRVGEQPHALH